MSEGLGAGAGPGWRRDCVLVRDSALPPAPLRAGVTGAAVPAQQMWTCRARVSSTLRTPGPSWPRTLTCHPLAVRLEPARAQRRHRRTPCASPSQDAADAGAVPGAPGPGVRLRRPHARWRQRSQRPWCGAQPVRRWPPAPGTRGLNARRCRRPRAASPAPPACAPHSPFRTPLRTHGALRSRRWDPLCWDPPCWDPPLPVWSVAAPRAATFLY